MKVISLLQSLSDKERKSFKDFLCSSFFISDVALKNLGIKLLEEIDKKHSCSKTDLWKSLFPHKEFKDSKFRQYTYKLNQALKDFIVFTAVNDDEILKTRVLAQFAKQRNIGILRSELIRFAENLRSTGELTRRSEISDLIEIQDSAYYIGSEVDRINNYQQESTKNALKFQLDLVNAYSSIVKNNHFLLENIHSRVSNTKSDGRIDTGISNNNIELDINVPIYSLLNSLYGLYTQEFNQSNINKVISQITLIKHKPSNELFDIYVYLKNYLIRELNKGRPLREEIFELMMIGLKNGLELSEGTLDIVAFNNAIILACSLKKIDEAFEIIDDYINYVDLQSRYSVKEFNLARINVEIGHYGEAVSHLSKVNYDTTGINVNARKLQIISFYELDEFDLLISTIQAFRIFLRRNKKVHSNRKKTFLDFCEIVYNLAHGTDKTEIERIIKAKEIYSKYHRALPSFSWLKEKIEEASTLLGIPTAES